MKLTKKQIIVFIGLCVIGVILTIFVIFNLMKKDDGPSTPKKVEEKIGEIAKENHEDEDFEKDPFQNKGIKEVSLHGYVFSKPEELTGAFINNAMPTIIDISKEHLLLKTGMNSLYVYNIKDGSTNVITQRVRQATIDPEEGRYVFYTVFEGNADHLYYYDTVINIDRGKLGYAAEGDILSLAYHKGALSYSYLTMPTEHENRGIVSRIAILPNFMKNYALNARDLEFEHTSGAQVGTKKGIYSYMPDTNTIDYLQIGQNTLPRIRVKQGEPTYTAMSVLDNNHWAVLEETKDKKQILRTNEGTFANIENGVEFSFLNEETLAIKEKDIVSVLHLKTGEKLPPSKEEEKAIQADSFKIKSSPFDAKKFASLKKPDQIIQKPNTLEVLDDNNWTLVEETQDHRFILHTRFGTFGSFVQLNGAYPLDNENMLLSDDGVLYLWNPEKNKKEVITSSVGKIKVNQSSIYYTGADSKIFEIKYEKK